MHIFETGALRYGYVNPLGPWLTARSGPTLREPSGSSVRLRRRAERQMRAFVVEELSGRRYSLDP